MDKVYVFIIGAYIYLTFETSKYSEDVFSVILDVVMEDFVLLCLSCENKFDMYVLLMCVVNGDVSF